MSAQQVLPLLVLDLDETLVHTREEPLDRSPDFRILDFHVYKRPHVDRFLKEMSSFYQLAVWSAASRSYVELTVARLMPPAVEPVFVFSSERCTRRFDYDIGRHYQIKNLKKVKRKGFDLRRVLIVEDSPENVTRNYGNAVYVRAFEGDLNDDELLKLSEYLALLSSEPDFRAVEKRGWRKSDG